MRGVGRRLPQVNSQAGHVGGSMLAVAAAAAGEMGSVAIMGKKKRNLMPGFHTCVCVPASMHLHSGKDKGSQCKAEIKCLEVYIFVFCLGFWIFFFPPVSPHDFNSVSV